MQAMNKPDPIQEFLQSLPQTGEVWTEEEAKMSTPYSDVETWTYILAGERMSGRSRYRGPPGLLTQVENLLSSTTAPEMISMLLERTIPIEKIKAGLDEAST